MTVQFKVKPNSSVHVALDPEAKSIYEEYKSFFTEGSIAKPFKFPAHKYIYIASYFLPHGAKKTAWEKHDTYQANVDNYLDLFKDIKIYLEQKRVAESWDGFKIVGVTIDYLNFIMAHIPECCMEYIKPIEKIYINGPKKTKDPFLAKKGGQYAKAI